MHSVRTTVSAVVAGILSTQAIAQPDVIVVSGLNICSSEKPTTSYGPLQRLDGIMFSFIDGVRFTPCKKGVRCDANTVDVSRDLKWPEGVWQSNFDHVWDGWGYYRLTFEGRQGSWDKSRSCDLDLSDFYEISRIISARKIADP